MRKILSFFFCILISKLTVSYAQNCNTTYKFSSNAIYSSCVSLNHLNSNLYWNYHSNGTVDVAFRLTGSTTSQWVTWGLNVHRSGMIGTQCLVAVTSSNGSVRAYTSAVNSYQTRLQPSSLSFEVSRISAERVNGDVVIYATLVLPSGRTMFTHLWQLGPVNNGVPGTHRMGSDNRNAVGMVDFTTGQTIGGSGNVGGSRQRQRNTHGVLNAVSWGVLMPMGAMAARYLKVFNVANPAWFYIHVACQTSAYGVGVAGWATGLKLGSESTGGYDTHRNIGLILFAFGTLQVFALLLRPKPDNKYRFYWNIYHHSIGYSVIILSIINVYEGLDILDPEKKWKTTYTGILTLLGVTAVVLEALTWFIVLKRKKEDQRTHTGTNGFYGANGYGQSA